MLDVCRGNLPLERRNKFHCVVACRHVHMRILKPFPSVKLYRTSQHAWHYSLPPTLEQGGSTDDQNLFLHAELVNWATREPLNQTLFFRSDSDRWTSHLNLSNFTNEEQLLGEYLPSLTLVPNLFSFQSTSPFTVFESVLQTIACWVQSACRKDCFWYGIKWCWRALFGRCASWRMDTSVACWVVNDDRCVFYCKLIK